MPRPRNGRCRSWTVCPGRELRRCGKRLPPENARSDLTTRTDVCDDCARVKLRAYLRSAAGQAWLAQYRAVMDDLNRLAREMGVKATWT